MRRYHLFLLADAGAAVGEMREIHVPVLPQSEPGASQKHLTLLKCGFSV